MNTYRRIARAGLLVLALLVLSTPTWAQTVLSSTTLAAAVTDSSGRQISLTSATGVTAPGSGSTQVRLLIDRELMTVTGLNGTIAFVQRGADGTRAVPHINGVPVWIAPPQAVSSYIPSGQCTRSTLQYVPYIVGAGPGLGNEVGNIYDCLGVTTSGQWVQTNGNGTSVLGSTVASIAGSIAITGTVFKVSGTNAVTGITAPAGLAAGFTIAINPTAVFTWTAAGNIALAGSAVVNKILYFTWDGSKWVPSYIA